jgi:hypothetical protein
MIFLDVDKIVMSSRFSNSFLNFYTDHKINKNSYIFRTKLINQYSGYIKVFDNKKNVSEQKIQTTNEAYFLNNSYGQKILVYYLLGNFSH